MTKKKPQAQPKKKASAPKRIAGPRGGGLGLNLPLDLPAILPLCTLSMVNLPMVSEERSDLTGEPNHAQGFLALVRCKGDGTVLTAFAEQSGDAAVAELIGRWHYDEETAALIDQVPDFRTLRVFRIGNPPPVVAA